MFDLYSTNNPIGWAHYFIAHLIQNCGVPEHKAIHTMLVESKAAKRDAFARNRYRIGKHHKITIDKTWQQYMSDNQCIMQCNRWYYKQTAKGLYVHGRYFQINWDAVKWWMEYL